MLSTDGPPRVTVTLIGISVVVAIITQLGSAGEMVRPFLISGYYGGALTEVRAGEIWRLITPIFIHFGILHIAFNMLWLWDLGGAVETRLGGRTLALLVLVIGVAGNLAEYRYSGPGFGGMSGVVYGLLGYVWMQSRFNPRSGLYLHQQIVAMMLIWFVLCWSGLIGNIANMAHTAGLVLGVAWGFLAARTPARRT